jgi:glucosamine-6-phosphate deaminase
MSPSFTVLDNAAAVAVAAADVVAELVRTNPRAVVGFPTGATPLLMYVELARRVSLEGLDFSEVTAVALDEYVGTPARDPRSFAYFLRRRVLQPLGIPLRRAILLDGTAAPRSVIAQRCEEHEKAILRAGGVDLQVLGIGRNGHLAFNEPGTPFESRTHVAELSPSTRAANSGAFDPDPVPDAALTQGLATIMSARSVQLIATGRPKAAALTAAFNAPPEVSCPASILQGHPDVHVVVDHHAAAGGLFSLSAR